MVLQSVVVWMSVLVCSDQLLEQVQFLIDTVSGVVVYMVVQILGIV